MKNKRLLNLLGGIVLISAAFLLLNFRLAVSRTEAEKLLFTTDMGENMPAAMQRRDKISMVLVGEGPLVRALGQSLTEKIDKAGIGEIELSQQLEPMYQNPVLIVKVGRPSPAWTPFFAMSQIPIHAGYTSDGDSSFMEPIEKTHTSVAKPDVSFLYAEYDIKDLSLGLISHPGYHQYLADYFAEEIVTALKNLYKV